MANDSYSKGSAVRLDCAVHPLNFDDPHLLAMLSEKYGDIRIVTESPVLQLKNPILDEGLAREGLVLNQETGYVQWGPGSADHPRNWSARRKAYDMFIIFFLELFTTVVSGAGSSAARFARDEYQVSRVVSLAAFNFMYQFGQALGGLFIPPYSESFGRRTTYLVSCIAFSIFCLLVGGTPSIIAAFVGRFVTGIASTVPSVVVAGSVEDLFDMKVRVWMVLVWNSATTAGLVLGPIYGSYIASAFGWRWIFHIAAAVTMANLLFLFFIRESRPSKLLSDRVDRLRAYTGDGTLTAHIPDHMPNFITFCRIALLRPLRLLVTEPLVIMISIMSATSWGLIYLLTDSLPTIAESFSIRYPHSTLPFLSLAVGILISILPRLWVMRIIRLKTAGQKPINPEDKIIGFSLAAPALALGLWQFSWTIPPAIPTTTPHWHWLIPMVGLLLIGFAANEMAYTLSGYLADAYTIYASSAFAALAFARALVSGLMPLFGFRLVEALGANAGMSVLAGVATVFCICPWIFARWGRRLREGSAFVKEVSGLEEEMGGMREP